MAHPSLIVKSHRCHDFTPDPVRRAGGLRVDKQRRAGGPQPLPDFRDKTFPNWKSANINPTIVTHGFQLPPDLEGNSLV